MDGLFGFWGAFWCQRVRTDIRFSPGARNTKTQRKIKQRKRKRKRARGRGKKLIKMQEYSAVDKGILSPEDENEIRICLGFFGLTDVLVLPNLTSTSTRFCIYLSVSVSISLLLRRGRDVLWSFFFSPEGKCQFFPSPTWFFFQFSFLWPLSTLSRKIQSGHLAVADFESSCPLSNYLYRFH